MVQRYDCKGAVVTHETGPFVLYEDYEHLKQKFMDYMVIKEKEIAYLKAILEVADANR